MVGTSADDPKPHRQAAESGLAAGEVGGQKVLWELGTQVAPTPVDVTSEIRDVTRSKSLLLIDPSGYQALYQPGSGERPIPIAADADEAFLVGATDEERIYGNELGSFGSERAVWWDCRRTRPPVA